MRELGSKEEIGEFPAWETKPLRKLSGWRVGVLLSRFDLPILSFASPPLISAKPQAQLR